VLARLFHIVSQKLFAKRANVGKNQIVGSTQNVESQERQKKGAMMDSKYQWLYEELAPKILVAALAEYGTTEVPGPANNPKILAWAQEIGSAVGIDYSKDSIPWCGLFMGVCAKRAGYEPPKICVRASEWAKFGKPAERAMLGDICVLTRQGGGHVGLYVGETVDGKYVFLLGGNQADAVNIKMFPRYRITDVRRCPWRVGQPPNVRPIILSNTGDLSTGEA